MKNVGDFNDLVAKLRDLEARLERRERHTHTFLRGAPVPVVTPPALEPPPEPPGCVTFSDDFERADGDIGPNWNLGLIVGEDDIPSKLTISSGAAIGPSRFGGAWPVGTMDWADVIVAENQFIEIVVENWLVAATNSMMEIEMYLFGGGHPFFGSEARRVGRFSQDMSSGQVRVNLACFTYFDDTGYWGGGAVGASYVQYVPYTGSSGPQTVRFESYGNGRQVMALNGVVVVDCVQNDAPGHVFSYAGHRQGLWMEWRAQAERTTSPRILSVTGGCLEPAVPVAWCDTFDRAELAPGWMFDPAMMSPGAPVETFMLIGGGAAYGVHAFVDWVSGGIERINTMRRTDPTGGAAQYVEAHITGLQQALLDNLRVNLYLITHYDQARTSWRYALFSWESRASAPPPPNQRLAVTMGARRSSGSSTQQSAVSPFGYPMSGKDDYVVRFESDLTSQRVYLDGALVMTWVPSSSNPLTPGCGYQGVQLRWDVQLASPPTAVSPLLVDVCGGDMDAAPTLMLGRRVARPSLIDRASQETAQIDPAD